MKKKIKPFSKNYPYIATWIEVEGSIVIGNDGFYASWIRVFNQGGLIVEIDQGETLDEAFSLLESYLKNDFEAEWGYEIEV